VTVQFTPQDQGFWHLNVIFTHNFTLQF
jgi:hypothetical protein